METTPQPKSPFFRPVQQAFIVIVLTFALFAAIAAVYLIGVAVGAPTAGVYYFLFLPLIWLWMTLPISISGMGVRETAFVFYFGLLGLAPETALTISVLVFVQALVVALLAGLHLAWVSRRRVDRA